MENIVDEAFQELEKNDDDDNDDDDSDDDDDGGDDKDGGDDANGGGMEPYDAGTFGFWS